MRTLIRLGFVKTHQTRYREDCDQTRYREDCDQTKYI